MRMEVHVHGTVPLLKGVTLAQLETALRPWLEYLDVDGIDEAKSLEQNEPGIALDTRERILEICWTGEVGRSFHQCVEASLQALCPYTAQAAEVELSYYDEEGETETQFVFVGPTPEAIHDAQRHRMVDDVSYMLARHFGAEDVDRVLAVVNELFDRERAAKVGGGAVARTEVTGGGNPGRKHLH